MKRKLVIQLQELLGNAHKKPILLTGARGVGKTFCALEFAKDFFAESVYINLEREPYLIALLESGSYIEVSKSLRSYFHLSESCDHFLLILDEINACKNIENIIPIITENNTLYHVLAITSNRLVKPIRDSFDNVNVYPLDFEEFLQATGNEWYIEVIKYHFESNKALPDIVHKELLAFWNLYLQIGGMPAAVNEYINTESIRNISEIHRVLQNSYLQDAYQNNDIGDYLKILQAYSTVENQLMKENHKFQYTLIRKGATQNIYANALIYIYNSFNGIFCNKIGESQLSFLSEEAQRIVEDMNTYKCFKLYRSDTGILYSNFQLLNTDITEPIKKGIMENYVAQSLVSNGYELQFWESGSQAKVDFIIIKNHQLIPIEVRITENTRSKNISVFKTKCSHVNDSIKISTRNFEYSNHVKYVPVYAVFCI